MHKKLLILIEILFVIGAITYYVIVEMIPEYKNKYGSSDKFFNSARYNNMIEFKIDDATDFSIVLDSNKVIYHIMFFDKSSIVLYNKDIENHSIDYVIDRIFQILIEEGVLFSNSGLTIVRYDDSFYSEILENIKSICSKYNLNLLIDEIKGSLEEKSLELGIKYNDNFLDNMDYFSKDIQRKYKNNKELIGITKLDSNSSLELASNVYMKIEDYVIENNITNLERDNDLLNIGTIPADKNLKFYPNKNSWYYVMDGHVYSYIEFNQGDNVFGYCYSGSIDLKNVGECIE